jgi:hypothetical protein
VKVSPFGVELAGGDVLLCFAKFLNLWQMQQGVFDNEISKTDVIMLEDAGQDRDVNAEVAPDVAGRYHCFQVINFRNMNILFIQ